MNTLVLAVVERTRELGMLRAIGATRRQVRRMIRHESIVTALLGGGRPPEAARHVAGPVLDDRAIFAAINQAGYDALCVIDQASTADYVGAGSTRKGS